MLYDGVYGPIQPNTLRELVCYKVFEARQEESIDRELVHVYAVNNQADKFSEHWKSYLSKKMPYVEGLQQRAKTDEATKAKELLERLDGRPILLKVPNLSENSNFKFAKPLFERSKRADPLRKNLPGENK